MQRGLWPASGRPSFRLALRVLESVRLYGRSPWERRLPAGALSFRLVPHLLGSPSPPQPFA